MKHFVYLFIFVICFFALSCKKTTTEPEITQTPIAGTIVTVLVTGGTFTMGSPKGPGNSDEQPQHSVTLSDFYIGKYEVTQKEWKEVVQWKQGTATTPLNPNLSFFTGDSLPVEKVSWNDVQTWLAYLNEREGLTSSSKQYRLPTEAEWEYAARGGTNWANNYTYSGSNTVDEVAWYRRDSTSTTHPVGTKTANELGLYDMSGNVCEWCNDLYGTYSSSAQTNPTGATSGGNRVFRGGSWLIEDRGCRVAARDYFAPIYRNLDFGFRLVRKI
jgi:sulfatase modifying factor 1